MEVAIPGSNNGGSPFRREVREWQRIDPNTGALLTGRLEADRWINGSLNSYGKVVDSQNVSQPNGTQHSQRKQLEVLQACTSSGSVQVIRSHTVQTTSSRRTATSSSSASSSSNSSSPLMASLNSADTSGYPSNYPQKFHANLCLSNESASENGCGNGQTTDEDHLTGSFHRPKAQQQKEQHQLLLSTAPSLKLSNLMKSSPAELNGSSDSQKKAILRRMKVIPPASPRLHGRHQFFASSLRQTKAEPSEPSSTPSTFTTPYSNQSRYTANLSSLNYDNDNHYDRPTIETNVGNSARIIDNCSQPLDDVGGDEFKNDDDNLNWPTSHCQKETAWQSMGSLSQRGRSASTEDLTSNRNATGTQLNIDNSGSANDDDNPNEWLRVSKIRRSFQFPSSVSVESSKATVTQVPRSRPLDLPEHSVKVSEIKAELENGRRLYTAMRNNHVDLLALDTILNSSDRTGNGQMSPLVTKKKTTSFLTAESLKEIRGRLKKLSDESLYKDDFITKDDAADRSSPAAEQDTQPYNERLNPATHSNSLESRPVKYKDTSSAEWHLRRKSYGFEKMSPPDDKSMFRFENSTDSGLGRSSDLGAWSPTTDSTSSPPRSTVITFGDQVKVSTSQNRVRPVAQRRLRNRTQPQSEAESAEMKRHSIAFEDSHYSRDSVKKTSIHLNGFSSKDGSPQSSALSDDNSRRPKRVEFCKTEVHFAAESGRVNIVETDGKPPPSNNFRRRRRLSGNNAIPSEQRKNPALPVTHFGDDRKANLAHPSRDNESNEDKLPSSNVTVSIPITVEKTIDSDNRDEEEHQDEVSIRGILKNKPIKPKPYHLGENIESAEALWGVQLKPVASAALFSERNQSEDDIKSVAERVKFVEKSKELAGYSTKINLNIPEPSYEWNETGIHKSNYDQQLENDFFGTQMTALNRINDEYLKSTPLIIKTLRLANQFDETMRRLSLSSTASSVPESKTSIASSTCQSINHQITAESTSTTDPQTIKSSAKNVIVSNLQTYQNPIIRPITPPRLKVVGSSKNTVSQQLTQLRRIYDYAELESDDSARADEEVKGYFGPHLDDDDENDEEYFGASEVSGSWRRVEAKHNTTKIHTELRSHKEIPPSNIVNIELHSPLATTIKKPETIRIQPPVAKPRTTVTVKQSTIYRKTDNEQSNKTLSNPVVVTQNVKSPEQLKIVKEARGARKLRDHELVYFGVKTSSADNMGPRETTLITSKPKLSTASKRSLPSRKLTPDEGLSSSKQWGDKPDLLRHSPILVEPQVVTKTAIVAPSVAIQRRRSKSPIYSSDDQTDGIYENIKPLPNSKVYCRQKDLQKDEMILNEMTRTADQTLKAVGDDGAARRDSQHHSISRRSSKPLETIDEKYTNSRLKRSSKLKTTTNRIVRECMMRTSSASSCDSLPHTTKHRRSRSRSQEKTEYVNVKPGSISRSVKHRSSSGESHHSLISSTEDINIRADSKNISKRSTSKDEPLLVKQIQNQQQRLSREHIENHDRQKVIPRSSTRDRAERHDHHKRSHSHRTSQEAVKNETDHKRSSYTATVDSKNSSKQHSNSHRNRTENELSRKPSKDRVSKSKGHTSHSQSDQHPSKSRRSATGSKSATVSSSGNNSNILISNGRNSHGSKTMHSTSTSSLKTSVRRSTGATH